jgi:transposase
MVILGVDAHKRTDTIVTIDDSGRQLATQTIATTTAGHLDGLRWANERWAVRLWAIEDCRHLSRRLERDLLVAGERVVRVPPKLMANARDSARTYGKSDPIDALAVARAVLREPDLPVAALDGPERQVRLLVDHREDLVGERTRAIARLRCTYTSWTRRSTPDPDPWTEPATTPSSNSAWTALTASSPGSPIPSWTGAASSPSTSTSSKPRSVPWRRRWRRRYWPSSAAAR